MTDNDEEWLTVEQVAQHLRVSVRHASRYGERVRTKKAGKRILYHRGDIEALGVELGVDNKPLVPLPIEMLPAGEMLSTIERHQAQLFAMAQQLADVNRELGRLQGVIEGQQPIIDEHPKLQQYVRELQADRDRLREALHEAERSQQPEPERRPWWRRLLDR